MKGKYREFENEILDIKNEECDRVSNLVISGKCRIPLVLLSPFGAYVFVETLYKKSTDITMAMFGIKKTLYLNCEGVYVFIRSPDADYVFSDHFISCEEITDKKVEDIIGSAKDTIVLSTSMIGNLKDHMKKFEDRGRRQILIKDGITYELHSVCFPLGFSVREQYFPVADDDPKKFLLFAVFGGLFGLHRFAAGEYLAGAFYLLTCGGFGIFFLFDIIAMLTGSYYVRQVSYEEDADTYRRRVSRIYLNKLKRHEVMWGVAGLMAAAVSSYLVYTKLFIPALCGIGIALIGA